MEINAEGKAILKRAQDTYGHQAELGVTIEELCELACVLSKVQRYHTMDEARKALYEKALDEYADVTIVLEHVKAAFELTDEDIANRVGYKLYRVQKWLDTNSDIAISTEIR